MRSVSNSQRLGEGDPLREGARGSLTRDQRQSLDDELVEPSAGRAWLISAAGVVLVVAVLYVGRGVLIPLAIAILLSFLLSPLTSKLRHWRVPRIPAVLLSTAVAFVVLGGIVLLIAVQGTRLAEELPAYQTNVTAKLRGLFEVAPGGGTLGRLGAMIGSLRTEIEAATADVSAPETEDVPVVQVREAPPTAFEILAQFAAPLLGPVGKAGLVVVLVFFMLLEREELRNRLIRLLGPDLKLTTEALNEASRRVSRYLLMQLVVNVTYGIPFGIGLYFIGIPNAFLWAALAVVLRFIPYLGPLLSAVFPLLLAIAVDPGWTMLLMTLALILTIELISNNFVEPWLYGASTSISAIAVILAAIFWTTLWGPMGLLLATPLTVCLAVMGRYFPQLAFLDVLLGSAPALSLPERFYQRLLAGDADENVAIAETYLREHGLADFYDDVALPALRLAAQDDARGQLSPERRFVVTRTALELVSELEDCEETDDAARPAESKARATADTPEREDIGASTADDGAATRSGVLCGAGRSGLDVAAASMLGQLLERRGFAARVVNAEALTPKPLSRLDLDGFSAICICCLDDKGVSRAQQTVRRLARHAPDKPVVLVFLNQPDADRPALEQSVSRVRRVTSLSETVQTVLETTAPASCPYTPAPKLDDEADRLREVHRLRYLRENDERFEPYTRRVAQAFGVPIALLTIVDEDSQHFAGQTGLPEKLVNAGSSPRDTSICGHVVAGNELLIVEDALKDPRFARNPFLLEHGIRFYAGVPLRGPGGHAVGSLCAIDAMPHQVTEEEKALLLSIAREVVEEFERRAANDDALDTERDAKAMADGVSATALRPVASGELTSNFVLPDAVP